MYLQQLMMVKGNSNNPSGKQQSKLWDYFLDECKKSHLTQAEDDEEEDDDSDNEEGHIDDERLL